MSNLGRFTVLQEIAWDLGLKASNIEQEYSI